MQSLKNRLTSLKNTPLTPLMEKILPSKVYSNVKDILIHDSNVRLHFDNHVFKINPKTMQTEGLMLISYWDGLPNFGDVIGPYLISKITGKPIINIYSEKLSGLLTVGSILQSINREGMTVWGSGLANMPTQETVDNLVKYKPEILSVRGHYTAKALLENGIQVPDSRFYGDPALILPKFFNPENVDAFKKISICPHFTHKPFFLKNIKNDNVRIVDVQESVEKVVSQINSSSVCISSSLHGLIIAQAYDIPWIWLEVDDKKLGFDDFKFNDFFQL